MKNTFHTIPYVSIIIPVFNSETYISRCLNSVLNQSIKEVEILIIDDISTDKSEQIILKYKKSNQCIKYIKLKEKCGAGGARNIGLKYAKGKYISFIDSDDWADSTMLEKMSYYLDKYKCEIALCGILTEFHDARSAQIRYSYDVENVIDSEFAIDLLTRRFNQDISISPLVGNKIYDKSFLKRNNLTFIPNCFNEDDAFNFLSFINAKKIVITPSTFYHYYQRDNSITHTFSKKHIKDLVVAFHFIKEYLLLHQIYETYRERYFSFFEKCLSFILTNLINLEPDYLVQNEYLKYLLRISRNILPINEYIDYLGVMRINNFILPYKIK
jgi:glycosyltransferase involved in cell wall biosynthesis